MPDQRNSAKLIQRMYKYSKALVDMVHSGWITRERLGRSHHLQMEVTMHLQVVGEAARTLRERDANLGDTIDLRAIAGMRNRISHDYEGVDWNIVEAVVFEDIPGLVEDLGVYMDAHDIQRIEIDITE